MFPTGIPLESLLKIDLTGNALDLGALAKAQPGAILCLAYGIEAPQGFATMGQQTWKNFSFILNSGS